MDLFSKNKIAIFSDLHLGLRNDAKFWHDVSMDWSKWFIADLKKNNIKDIVFCGDLFHSRDELCVDTLNLGTKFLKQFNDFNLHLIVGNHDAHYKDSSEINSISQYNEWKNITVYDKPVTVTHNNKLINFIPWGTKIEDIAKSDITFGHFEIKLFKMNCYSICDEGMTSDELLEKCNLLVSGHFHNRDQRDYTNGTILYVGNPFQMDFNDAGTTKGYYILDIETEKTEFIENTISPKHCNVKMSDLCSESGITDRVKHWFNNNLVKLRVDRRVSSDHMEFILSKLRTLNPIDLTIDYQSQVHEYGMYDERKDFSGIDLKQAIKEFIGEMDISNAKEVENYTLDLYDKMQL